MNLCVRVVLVLQLLELWTIAESQRTVTFEDRRSWKVTITPSSQKVAEGSMAMFTCESSLPADVRFGWSKPAKPINEEKDEVEIVQIAHNRSVLRVNRAHIQKHRRTYRCTVYFDDPETGGVLDKNLNAVLKVIPTSKLNKDFPKVTSKVDDSIAPLRFGLVTLACDIQGYWSKSVPQYTWIKDSTINLNLEKENWQNADDMRMLYVDPHTRPGQYQCAVFYKKGSVTVYGNIITLDQIQKNCTNYNGTAVRHGDMYNPTQCEICMCDNGKVGCVDKEDIDTCCEYACADVASTGSPCTDHNAIPVRHGDIYRPGDNPCETCLCTDGIPTLCSEAVCDAPPCPHHILIPDTCCGFECLDCLSYDGRFINEGDVYQPSEDPCETCVCEKGKSTQCFNVACMKPTLPCPEPIPIPGECCKFTCETLPRDLLDFLDNKTACVAYNGSSVATGQSYNPDSDPCKACTCRNGQPVYCMNVACMPPPMPCDDPRPVPGKCCEFTCENPGTLLTKECVAYNGDMVPIGSYYKPDSDPCKTCSCHNGQPHRCMMVACMPPPMSCARPRQVPGECCNFTCDEPGDGMTLVQKDCIGYNGSTVASGQLYKPDRDPCRTCSCKNGQPEHCIMVACQEPPMPCARPRPVPGECCRFTCEPPSVEQGCMSFNGSMVPFGTMYQIGEDPCRICECSPGDSACMIVSCAMPPMPCPNPRQVPNECCSFTCNQTVPVYNMEEDRHRMPIQIKPYVQQIGPQTVMVQGELPNMEPFEEITNVTVYFSRGHYLGHFEIDSGMDHVIVRGLNQSQTYKVWATAEGKLHNPNEMVARDRFDPIDFTLDPRATSSLNLEHAIGQVYESRGSVTIGPFSMPRPFEPINVADWIHVTMNLNTFNMVEISTYTDRPCPKMECGLMRFYMYNMTGHAHNVMSLMFGEDMDFQWAKAHL